VPSAASLAHAGYANLTGDRWVAGVDSCPTGWMVVFARVNEGEGSGDVVRLPEKRLFCFGARKTGVGRILMIERIIVFLREPLLELLRYRKLRMVHVSLRIPQGPRAVVSHQPQCFVSHVHGRFRENAAFRNKFAHVISPITLASEEVKAEATGLWKSPAAAGLGSAASPSARCSPCWRRGANIKRKCVLCT
jgi:hypothetical protein